MQQQLLVIELVVDVKAVPEVATDDHTAESKVTYHLNRVKVHTTEGIYLFVDESLSRGFFQFIHREA